MAKLGRPRANIDIAQFEGLCRLQCTENEICDWFNITDKTLNRWCKDTYGATFSDIFRQKRNAGKISLRRTLFQQAEKNPSVAIFLAKNFLGMSDKVENTIAGALPVIIDGANELKD